MATANNITVTIDTSDIVKQIVFFKDLPTVTGSSRGTYRTENGIRWIPLDSTDPYNDINTHIRGLMAIKLRMEADAKAEADSFNAKLKQAAERIEAENKAAEAKKAHDDLRTSPIALKALALYNRECIGYGPYASWDATNSGEGISDRRVKDYIELAEAEEAKEKEAAEKLAARRDALAKELCDGTSIGPWYEAMGTVHKRAIDRIIELEDKAA